MEVSEHQLSSCITRTSCYSASRFFVRFNAHSLYYKHGISLCVLVVIRLLLFEYTCLLFCSISEETEWRKENCLSDKFQENSFHSLIDQDDTGSSLLFWYQYFSSNALTISSASCYFYRGTRFALSEVLVGIRHSCSFSWTNASTQSSWIYSFWTQAYLTY